MKPVNREELLVRLDDLVMQGDGTPVDSETIRVTKGMAGVAEWFDFGRIDKEMCRRAALDARPFRQAGLLRPPYPYCIFRTRFHESEKGFADYILIIAYIDGNKNVEDVLRQQGKETGGVETIVMSIMIDSAGNTQTVGTHHIKKVLPLPLDQKLYDNVNLTVIYDALWLILNTRGIRKTVDEPSAKLNKARAKTGRLPLQRVTRIDASQYMRALQETERMERDGHHTSPRMHLRRAHLRTMRAERFKEAKGKTIVIDAMIVNIDSDSIVVRDHYEVRT